MLLTTTNPSARALVHEIKTNFPNRTKAACVPTNALHVDFSFFFLRGTHPSARERNILRIRFGQRNFAVRLSLTRKKAKTPRASLSAGNKNLCPVHSFAFLSLSLSVSTRVSLYINFARTRVWRLTFTNKKRLGWSRRARESERERKRAIEATCALNGSATLKRRFTSRLAPRACPFMCRLLARSPSHTREHCLCLSLTSLSLLGLHAHGAGPSPLEIYFSRLVPFRNALRYSFQCPDEGNFP